MASLRISADEAVHLIPLFYRMEGVNAYMNVYQLSGANYISSLPKELR